MRQIPRLWCESLRDESTACTPWNPQHTPGYPGMGARHAAPGMRGSPRLWSDSLEDRSTPCRAWNPQPGKKKKKNKAPSYDVARIADSAPWRTPLTCIQGRFPGATGTPRQIRVHHAIPREKWSWEGYMTSSPRPLLDPPKMEKFL